MDILLIAVPFTRIKYNISGIYPMPPLGLAYLASFLRGNNFKVKILDLPALKFSNQQLSSYLHKKSYSLYGLSCTIFSLEKAIEISNLIRQINPSSIIVIGGHCTVFPSEILFMQIPSLDIVVRNEGEKTMLDLCLCISNKKDLSQVKGISFKSEGKIIDSPSNPYLNLDEIPFPSRDLLPNYLYKMHPPFCIYPPLTTMETARGCSYKCEFCTLSKDVRERSPQKVIEEVKEVIDKYKVREIHFVDPTFTYNQKRISTLCELLIANNIKIYWTCKTRIDLVSEELLNKMSEAGCYAISYGIESGSQKNLNILNKNINLAQISNCLKLTKKAKIRSAAYLMVGSPGEDEHTVDETINFVKKIKPDYVLYSKLLPDPASAITERSLQNEEITYNDLIDYYFKGYPSASIDKEIFSRWMSKAYKSFYLNPRYILQRILDLKNIRDFFNLIKGAYFLILEKLLR